MAYLGVDYCIGYESKNYTSGLPVVAMVRKPDATIVGPFTLTEIPDLAFKGIYETNFETSAYTDPEGEYIALLISPNENVRSVVRFTLVSRCCGVKEPVGDIYTNEEITASISPMNEIQGEIIFDQQLIAMVDIKNKGTTTHDEL